jgi:hypothetical protein
LASDHVPDRVMDKRRSDSASSDVRVGHTEITEKPGVPKEDVSFRDRVVQRCEGVSAQTISSLRVGF